MKTIVSRSLKGLDTKIALDLEGLLCILYYNYSLVEVSMSLLQRGFSAWLLGFARGIWASLQN